MAKRTTIMDIARQAGVSRQTVVRALSDQPRISPSTRARVLEVADRLDYRPNRAAQALVGAPTMMLSMVIGDLRNPFFAEVANSFSVVVGEAGYSVMLMRRPSTGDLQEVARRIGSYNVDGAVLYPHALHHAAVETMLNVVPKLVLVGAASRHNGCSEVVLGRSGGSGPDRRACRGVGGESVRCDLSRGPVAHDPSTGTRDGPSLPGLPDDAKPQLPARRLRGMPGIIGCRSPHRLCRGIQ